MKKNIIPFLRPSLAGDYLCPDGEIATLTGCRLIPASGISSPVESSPSDSSDKSDKSDPSDPRVSIALPQIPNVTFGLERVTLPGWHNHPDIFPGKEVASPGVTSEAWGARAMTLLSQFSDEAARNALFIEPFFAVAALRTHEGTLICPTPPVLLIPNSGPLTVGGELDFSAPSMHLRIAASVCRLRIDIAMPGNPQEWRNAASSLEFFVTPAIPLWLRKEAPVPYHRLGDFPMAWQPLPPGDAETTKALLSATSFYKVAEIRAEDFGSGDAELRVFTPFPTLDPYVPDFAHLQGIEAAYGTMISRRLTLCDLTLTLPATLPFSSYIPASAGSREGDGMKEAVSVTCVKGGIRKTTAACRVVEAAALSEESMPKWLFFPDPDAVEMSVVNETGTFTFPLTRHPLLHGAYYLYLPSAEGVDPRVTVSATRLSGDAQPFERRDSTRLSNALWRSTKESRTLFPSHLFSILDTGRAIAVVRAFRASGLIATTSPTAYLFADTGIFLLKEMEDGTLRDAGLMATCVLRDAGAFAVNGTTLSFITREGESLMISGSKVVTAEGKSLANSEAQAVRVIVEAGEGKAAVFTTRPLKLGEPETRKILKGVTLRGDYDPGRVTLTLEGSETLREWKVLARARGAIRGVRLHPMRFFRLTASLTAPARLEAMAFTLSD